MKNNWNVDELIEYFTFLPNELSEIGNKTGETRIGFAVLFKFFQNEARFPDTKDEIPLVIINYIAKQIEGNPKLFENYDFESRSFFYHKSQIRKFFGFREVTLEDGFEVTNWLYSTITHNDITVEYHTNRAYARFRELKIEPPTSDRIARIVRSALNTYETKFFDETFDKIPTVTKSKIDIFMDDSVDKEERDENEIIDFVSFGHLRAAPGRVGLESILQEVKKARAIKELDIPTNLFDNLPHKTLKIYKQRISSESFTEIMKHPAPIKYTLLTAFFSTRMREITDNLIELLIHIIHKIGSRAARKVDKEFIKDFKLVKGKNNLLYQLADIALNNPEGIVKEGLFDVLGG